jgi:anti-anti-sigma regulatory factor
MFHSILIWFCVKALIATLKNELNIACLTFMDKVELKVVNQNFFLLDLSTVAFFSCCGVHD